ncbi:uncharacterized protein LOC106131059, partial [Amyelois transitella]|uniref:uncharacterized protein LOC106131059 n=1 Tax=Amyelois transitella TaxID=680683 RepID=UPI0029904AC3
MENGLINTLENGNTVTSTYADVYFDDDYCDFKKIVTELKAEVNKIPSNKEIVVDEWKSPSDLLIGILELQPPFTSKITRGITHEGILAIGDNVLEIEQAKFLARVNRLVNENNAAWEFILDYEKKKIGGRVKKLYDKIFSEKSKIMKEECLKYYESSLQDLENHLRSEIKKVLVSAHSNVISDLNPKIITKLKKEKDILNDILKKRFDNEIGKIKAYYQMLLKNEMYRNHQLYNQALQESNDALQAFVTQADAESITGTMYVMCAERKKCKINHFLIESYQTLDIADKIKRIKEKQGIIDDYKKKDVRICSINKDWEEKIRKVLQLFLKFISYSLKLLPEQTTFLLDFEKMVVLQLNELQKLPFKAPSILVEENVFNFVKPEAPPDLPCKKPFEIVGDTAESIPTRYGSRETLPSHVDLPTIRLGRQYLYAKCHKYEEIKAVLDSQKCKCAPKTLDDSLISYIEHEEITQISQPSTSSESTTTTEFSDFSQLTSEPSFQHILFDDIKRFDNCPARQCTDWIQKSSFPYLNSYLNYTEENFKRLKVILGKPQKFSSSPDLLNAKDIVFKDVPYAETFEPYNNVETQYSSQENFSDYIKCNCYIDTCHTLNFLHEKPTENSEKFINEILAKRKISLRRLMQENPRLLKIFTDESF